MLGLAGAHRVGKSTLAQAYAKKHGWQFAATSVSSIIRDLGHEPNEAFDFRTRLSIQEQVLIRMSAFYKKVEGASVITDRTPLDMAMYTMAEAVGEAVSDADQGRFKRYIEDCFALTNKWFAGVIVVQPGIPIVYEDGKAILNEAYIEHLNSLIIGLCSDGRLKVPHYYIPRTKLALKEREDAVHWVVGKSNEAVLMMTQGLERANFH